MPIVLLNCITVLAFTQYYMQFWSCYEILWSV